MNQQLLYRIAADIVLFVHVLFVAFVVVGFLLVLLGGVMRWQWVRNKWFRYSHLLGIGIVVLQAWLGMICPLTIWEMELRAKAGEAVYSGSFLAHWLEWALYYSAPPWVFVVVYTLFGLLVAASWYFIRPK